MSRNEKEVCAKSKKSIIANTIDPKKKVQVKEIGIFQDE